MIYVLHCKNVQRIIIFNVIIFWKTIFFSYQPNTFEVYNADCFRIFVTSKTNQKYQKNIFAIIFIHQMIAYFLVTDQLKKKKK